MLNKIIFFLLISNIGICQFSEDLILKNYIRGNNGKYYYFFNNSKFEFNTILHSQEDLLPNINLDRFLDSIKFNQVVVNVMYDDTNNIIDINPTEEDVDTFYYDYLIPKILIPGVSLQYNIDHYLWTIKNNTDFKNAPKRKLQIDTSLHKDVDIDKFANAISFRDLGEKIKYIRENYVSMEACSPTYHQDGLPILNYCDSRNDCPTRATYLHHLLNKSMISSLKVFLGGVMGKAENGDPIWFDHVVNFIALKEHKDSLRKDFVLDFALSDTLILFKSWKDKLTESRCEDTPPTSLIRRCLYCFVREPSIDLMIPYADFNKDPKCNCFTLEGKIYNCGITQEHDVLSRPLGLINCRRSFCPERPK